MRLPLNIRTRMLLAALLPVGLIAVLLVAVFLMVRVDDMQQSYQQRTRLVARQLAVAAEYSLFAANLPQLQALAQGAMHEPDVRAVAFLDRSGQVLVHTGQEARSGQLAYTAQAAQWFDARRRLDWLAEPVFTGGVQLDALYEDQDRLPHTYANAMQLGQVQVIFSRRLLDDRQRDILLLGAGIGLLGLLFGGALALYLSRGVLQPIMRLTRQIERIGTGDFAAAKDLQQADHSNDPLRAMQDQLQRMADQLASARDDLQRQVREATQALREKKEEAELVTQAKSRFLAAASHDLRQPIHAIGMFVTRLAQLSHDEETGQLIRHLESSVAAMQSLLNGLLDISRLDAQAVQVNKRDFALCPLLNQLQHDLAQSAQNKGLRLRARPCDLWVHSDPVLLYRILLNLVGNALNYTERGGVLVAARLCHGGRQVLLQVWDSGIGIAPEHQQAVFMEFYQVANVPRDHGFGLGLGLGLNIVQRTAALLDHPLQLLSRPGQGTRFTLTLPHAISGVAGAVATGASLPDDLSGVTVLVIEDDALVRSALAGLLHAWGLQVIEAQDWRETQAQLAADRIPDLVVSDYRLPGSENGLQVVQMLRERLGQDLPACLISGDTDAELVRMAQAAGLTLLQKPVRPAKLRNLLRRLLKPPAGPQREELGDFE